MSEAGTINTPSVLWNPPPSCLSPSPHRYLQRLHWFYFIHYYFITTGRNSQNYRYLVKNAEFHPLMLLLSLKNRKYSPSRLFPFKFRTTLRKTCHMVIGGGRGAFYPRHCFRVPKTPTAQPANPGTTSWSISHAVRPKKKKRKHDGICYYKFLLLIIFEN